MEFINGIVELLVILFRYKVGWAKGEFYKCGFKVFKWICLIGSSDVEYFVGRKINFVFKNVFLDVKVNVVLNNVWEIFWLRILEVI